MEEQDRIREGRVREQAFARDRDCEAEPGDDDREREEGRSSGVARMDAEFLRQHEAEQPDHPHAPTMRRKAASRFDSGPRISSTLPVATIVPSWITATRSQSFSAMSSRWEAMNTVPPPPIYSWRNSLSFRWKIGSRLMKGSSKKAREGSCKKAA